MLFGRSLNFAGNDTRCSVTPLPPMNRYSFHIVSAYDYIRSCCNAPRIHRAKYRSSHKLPHREHLKAETAAFWPQTAPSLQWYVLQELRLCETRYNGNFSSGGSWVSFAPVASHAKFFHRLETHFKCTPTRAAPSASVLLKSFRLKSMRPL
jgi:hypothetical protein